MKTNKEQLLRNPDIEPTCEVIAKSLGEANDTFVKFISELDCHGIQLEWHYYTDGKAWLGKGLYKWTGTRGGQKETTVFWLSIWDGFFKVTVYVPIAVRAEVLNLTIDDRAKDIVSNSEQMGKLKFFPILFDLYSEELLKSLFTIIDFRKSIAK